MTAREEFAEGRSGVSLAEEVRLLVEMVVERAAPWLDGVIAAGHGTAAGTGEEAGGTVTGQSTPEGGCGWCPLCAVVAVARGERPEFAARVLEQATQLIALLRAVLADRWEPQEGVHMPGFQPATAPAEEPPAPARGEPEGTRVQRIPVRPRAQWHPDGE
jgi:hypothetical protein